MATREQATNWLNSQKGASLDFDKAYSLQCVDFFNYYYLFLTGRNPYSDGYGVAGAKDLWNVPTSLFTKVANNPNDPNQIPQAGDILIYNSRWGGGYGHIEVVLGADSKGVTVIGQNMLGKNDPVSTTTRGWATVVPALIGWLSFNGFTSTSVQPNQRIVGSNGVNCRERPTINSPIVKEGEAGEVLTFKGFVKGEDVSGNNIWFVGAFSGVYCWSGAFTNITTAGLPDITPVALPLPEPPKEPAYTFEKDLACVTEVIPAGTQNFQYGNFTARPEKAVIHEFGTRGVDTVTSVINTIKNNGSRVVSAHFVISGKRIIQMVSLKDRAYHAGVNGNNFIGIETDPAQDEDTINSARAVLKELNSKYGYNLALVKHSSLMSTACGDDIDLAKYDITPVPPTIPEPPVVPENPVPDTPEKPEEKPEVISGSLLDFVLNLISKIKDWLSQWRKK